MAEEAMRPRTHCRRSIPGSDPFSAYPLPKSRFHIGCCARRTRCHILYKRTVIGNAMSASSLSLESLHPSLWRGSQLARGGPRTVDTGYAALSVEFRGAAGRSAGSSSCSCRTRAAARCACSRPRSRRRAARGGRSRSSRRRSRRTRARSPALACRSTRCCGCARAATRTRCGRPSRRSRPAAAARSCCGIRARAPTRCAACISPPPARATRCS